ncbi:hypothetical protein F8388_019434 [Cannabis sativa]|uniref:Uncharacterized protein n=1 Tax=Cannabis sativa TaxID=3483 RepID=A0A7J6FFX8_CANSA|nr:hypothetical protein F8388_019434 [Cannabis sativa]
MLGRLGLLQYMLTKGKGISSPENMEVMSVLMDGEVSWNSLLLPLELGCLLRLGLEQKNVNLLASLDRPQHHGRRGL